jgi:hypothetical protein
MKHLISINKYLLYFLLLFPWIIQILNIEIWDFIFTGYWIISQSLFAYIGWELFSNVNGHRLLLYTFLSSLIVCLFYYLEEYLPIQISNSTFSIIIYNSALIFSYLYFWGFISWALIANEKIKEKNNHLITFLQLFFIPIGIIWILPRLKNIVIDK